MLLVTTPDWSPRVLRSNVLPSLLLTCVFPEETKKVFVDSSGRYGGRRGYLNSGASPRLLLVGFTLGFVAPLQPAAVSLQLGPHFGGEEHRFFVRL